MARLSPQLGDLLDRMLVNDPVGPGGGGALVPITPGCLPCTGVCQPPLPRMLVKDWWARREGGAG